MAMVLRRHAASRAHGGVHTRLRHQRRLLLQQPRPPAVRWCVAGLRDHVAQTRLVVRGQVRARQLLRHRAHCHRF